MNTSTTTQETPEQARMRQIRECYYQIAEYEARIQELLETLTKLELLPTHSPYSDIYTLTEDEVVK